MIRKRPLIKILPLAALLLMLLLAGCKYLPEEQGSAPGSKAAALGASPGAAPAPANPGGRLGIDLSQVQPKTKKEIELSQRDDVLPPETELDTLPQSSNNTAVLLKWKVLSGADEISHFELQYRDGKGDWQALGGPVDPREREMLFWGKMDHVYEFRLRAINLIGMVEDFPEFYEATVYILPRCEDDAYEGKDAGDDARESAQIITPMDKQTHTWCPLGDEDWVLFEAKAGEVFTLRAKPLALGSAAVIHLLDPAGNLLAEAAPKDYSAATRLNWKAEQDGTYAVRLTPAKKHSAGDGAMYEFSVEQQSNIRLVILPGAAVVLLVVLALLLFSARRVKQAKSRKGLGW